MLRELIGWVCTLNVRVVTNAGRQSHIMGHENIVHASPKALDTSPSPRPLSSYHGDSITTPRVKHYSSGWCKLPSTPLTSDSVRKNTIKPFRGEHVFPHCCHLLT